MATNTIDAALVQKMFLAGAKNLESKRNGLMTLMFSLYLMVIQVLT